MGNFYAPSAFNLRVPSEDIWSQPDGRLSDSADRYLRNLTQLLQQIGGIQVAFSGEDGTAALQAAVGQAINQGGGQILLPGRPFSISAPIVIPANAGPIWIIGQGRATMITRSAAMPPGMGIFDVSASNFTMSDFWIDGGRVTPIGLRYNADFVTSISANDPMAPSLTNNTSVWVHGAASGLRFERMGFTHAAGYSILLDALTGDISDVSILDSWFTNNRPTLFGIALGDLVYGSYNGGILAKSDGRSAMGSQSGVVSGLLVQGCNINRVTGNAIWSHGYGFSRFNSQIRYLGNKFLDCGLDAILVDIVSGGTVEGNTMRRVGYTTIDDTAQSVPRWLANLNATGIDSGAVKGVNYVGNSLMSINGGMVDLDTHCLGDVTGNICRIPYADEPEFTEDRISITGPTNSGNGSYGYNLGVNYGFGCSEGGSFINITGNTLLNLPAGAMRLFSARNCLVTGNLIQAPDDSTYNPIATGPQGAAAYNRSYSNRISGNHIVYSPTGGAPTDAILETDALSGGNPMTAGDINYVFNNIIVGTGATEFAKAIGSGSTVYAATVWFP